MSSLAQRKAQEYLNMLKQKSEKEIVSMRDNLRGRMKNERAKSEPDQSALQNLNYQLSLIGRELGNRKPVEQKERLEVIAEDQELSVGGKEECSLKSKTLDDLNKMLSDEQKKLDTLVYEQPVGGQTPLAIGEQAKIVRASIESIKNEISSRSPQASKEAKRDIGKAEGKIFGVDSDMITVGAIAGVMGGAIGWGMGKSAWVIAGFSIVGIGAGAGLVYLAKKDWTATKAAPETKKV
jgi:hypothetical protein